MQNIYNKSLPLRYKKSIAFEGIDFLYRGWFDTDFRIIPKSEIRLRFFPIYLYKNLFGTSLFIASKSMTDYFVSLRQQKILIKNLNILKLWPMKISSIM